MPSLPTEIVESCFLHMSETDPVRAFTITNSLNTHYRAFNRLFIIKQLFRDIRNWDSLCKQTSENDQKFRLYAEIEPGLQSLTQYGIDFLFKHGNLSFIQYVESTLVQSGSKLHVQPTQVSLAVNNGHCHILEYLKKRKYNLTPRWNPLTTALFKKDYEMVSWWIDNSSNLCIPLTWKHSSELEEAFIMRNRKGIVHPHF